MTQKTVDRLKKVSKNLKAFARRSQEERVEMKTFTADCSRDVTICCKKGPSFITVVFKKNSHLRLIIQAFYDKDLLNQNGIIASMCTEAENFLKQNKR
jgi:hypothetical protein